MARFRFSIKTITEGSVEVLVPRSNIPVKKMPVFYNPAMRLNRDIAILVLRVYRKILGRDLSVCEPLAGCGIRGIRFAVEVPGVEKVVINDLNPEAAKLAKYNVRKNGLASKVLVENNDADFLLSMYSAPTKRFDYVDIDPFGSPAPFMDSAVRALHSGGLLGLTATDMAPLCGVHPQACLRKYGGRPLRTEYCHELAVRILVGCLALTTARYDAGIRVLFSHSTDHYVRSYILIKHSVREANRSIGGMGYVLHCFNCFHRETATGISRLTAGSCPECGERLSVAGALWLGGLFDRDFCHKMRDELKKINFEEKHRLKKLLDTVLEEADGTPTYYVIDRVCDKYDWSIPPTGRIFERLLAAGYKATPTHFHVRGVRTNAPAKKFVEIFKQLSRA